MRGFLSKGYRLNQETKRNDYNESKRLLFRGMMEGLIPPLSDSSSPKRARVDENGLTSNPANNDDKERKRRARMNESYSELKSMVPSLVGAFNKLTKEQIVDETIKYVKHLEEEARRLEILKKLRIRQSEAAKQALSKCSNQNVPVKATAISNVTFLAIQRSYERGLLPKILKVFQKHQAQVLEARIDVSDHWILTFTTTLMLASDGGGVIQKIKEEILAL